MMVWCSYVHAAFCVLYDGVHVCVCVVLTVVSSSSSYDDDDHHAAFAHHVCHCRHHDSSAFICTSDLSAPARLSHLQCQRQSAQSRRGAAAYSHNITLTLQRSHDASQVVFIIISRCAILLCACSRNRVNCNTLSYSTWFKSTNADLSDRSTLHLSKSI